MALLCWFSDVPWRSRRVDISWNGVWVVVGLGIGITWVLGVVVSGCGIGGGVTMV